ncbi:MAG TPA: site-2 protease family protein, partial [Candidatus Avimonas sp.]|nr:site-2 protease family protein [Candidatus Avimonas sp.]
ITGFNTTRVDEVGEDSPAAVAGIEPGDRIVSYNGMRVYQPADLIQFIYVEEGTPAVIGIERNGKKMKLNFVPEIIPEKEVYRFGFSARSAEGPDSNVIALVSPGTPAEKSGLMPGDRIVKLNDTEIREKRDIDSFMLENRGKPVKMVLERNGSRITVDITPAAVKIPRQYYVGMSFEFDSGSVPRAIRHSMVFTWSTIKNVGYTVVWFAKGKVSLKNLVGPIGMVDTIVDVVEQGVNNIDKIIRLLNITAFLSVALGATNLIPIPALDGNKLLLIAIEAIRRKPIPPEKEAFINMIGFVMLLAILIFTLYNDTIRLIFG